MAEAIAMCSKWGNNAKRFCDEGAVKPMVEYLGSHDIIVQRSAMRALEQLGKNPESCIIMHRSGVVKVTSLFSKYHGFSFAESKICSNEASKRVHQKNILFLFAAVSFQRTQHVPCPSYFDVTSPFALIELIFLSRMLLPRKQELQLPRLIYCKGATNTFDIFCIIVAKCCALYHTRIQPVLLQIISLIYCSLRKVAAK